MCLLREVFTGFITVLGFFRLTWVIIKEAILLF